MFILVTNAPKSKQQAATWTWTTPPPWASTSVGAKQGTTADDRLWWAFSTKQDAIHAKRTMRQLNIGKANDLRLFILQTEHIPDGWQY
jgi:hypothetical protein